MSDLLTIRANQRTIARDRPTAIPDGTDAASPFRGDRYGGQHVSAISNKELFAADEGSYYVGISATPGTGIIGHAAPTTFDETKPYLLVYNGGTNRIYPQILKFHETVVSTAATRCQWTFTIDDGNRLSSAGTAVTVNNGNMASSNASGAVIKQGAPVATAASGSRRVLGHFVVRSTIDVVEDNLTFVFGDPSAGQDSVAPATVMNMTVALPPVVIGPGQSFMAYQWSASQSTGPTLEVVFGFIER